MAIVLPFVVCIDARYYLWSAFFWRFKCPHRAMQRRFMSIWHKSINWPLLYRFYLTHPPAAVRHSPRLCQMQIIINITKVHYTSGLSEFLKVWFNGKSLWIIVYAKCWMLVFKMSHAQGPNQWLHSRGWFRTSNLPTDSPEPNLFFPDMPPHVWSASDSWVRAIITHQRKTEPTAGYDLF